MVERPKPPKAGGAAADETGAVEAAKPKPPKAGVAAEVEVAAPNAGGAVPAAPPKPPNPPEVAVLVAGALKPESGATVAVGAPKPPKVVPPPADEAGGAPRAKPEKMTILGR